MKRIIYFIKKEFQQFRRDPKMFGIILIAPVIQLIFLGYAANLDVDKIKTVVYDQDKTYESRKLIERFTSSNYFKIYDYTNNYREVTNYIDNGKVILAIVIPKDFEKNINRNQTTTLQIIFDGSDGNTANIAGGYIQGIVTSYAKNLIVKRLNRIGLKSIPAGSISAEERIWYNPTLKTRNFMVPAIVGLLLSVITLILTSLAVVKEKEIGTMEQLIVTPLKPHQIIIGKLVPYVLLGFLAIIIVLTAMRVIFNIPVKGDIIFLFFSAFLYILSALGLGLFVSTISKTQQQAMMLAIFVVLMPMVFLSGFAFPVENMPQIIQLISYLVPLRYFIDIIRGVVTKGLGFAELWQNAAVLLFMGVLILSLSTLRFKRKMD